MNPLKCVAALAVLIGLLSTPASAVTIIVYTFTGTPGALTNHIAKTDTNGQNRIDVYGYSGAAGGTVNLTALYQNNPPVGLGVVGNGTNQIDAHDYTVLDFSLIASTAASIDLKFNGWGTGENVLIYDLSTAGGSISMPLNPVQNVPYNAGSNIVHIQDFSGSGGPKIFAVGVQCSVVLSEIDVTPRVPEPATFCMIGAALILAGVLRRRCRRS